MMPGNCTLHSSFTSLASFSPSPSPSVPSNGSASRAMKSSKGSCCHALAADADACAPPSVPAAAAAGDACCPSEAGGGAAGSSSAGTATGTMYAGGKPSSRMRFSQGGGASGPANGSTEQRRVRAEGQGPLACQHLWAAQQRAHPNIVLRCAYHHSHSHSDSHSSAAQRPLTNAQRLPQILTQQPRLKPSKFPFHFL